MSKEIRTLAAGNFLGEHYKPQGFKGRHFWHQKHPNHPKPLFQVELWGVLLTNSQVWAPTSNFEHASGGHRALVDTFHVSGFHDSKNKHNINDNNNNENLAKKSSNTISYD